MGVLCDYEFGKVFLEELLAEFVGGCMQEVVGGVEWDVGVGGSGLC